MKKNRISEKRKSEPRNQSKKQPVFRSNNHRVHDDEFEAEYDAFFDEVDQFDLAISERSFLDELDRRSRNRRPRSRPRYWSPEWDHDEDDWN